jgi:hypothetical protein
MKLRNRALLRTGAAVAGFVVASSAFAAPAFADTTADLGIKIDGGTISVDSDVKDIAVSLTNAGPSDATDILVVLDVSGLLKDKVSVSSEGCDAVDEDGHILCGIQGDKIPVGVDIDWFFELSKVPGATGSAGSITASIFHGGDDNNPANNSFTREVTVGEQGVDLGVWAPDVYRWDDTAKFFTEEPIAPGGESLVYVEVINYGGATAQGFKIDLRLPAHATLTAPEPDCVFSADLTSASCEYKELWLEPFATGGKVHTFVWPIKVAADAPGEPLVGGTATVDAMGIKVEEPTLTRKTNVAPAELPEHFKDVDATDNTDDYSIFVADTSGGGGGLPVTGPAATVIGGAGAAILVLGTVLFVSARRRRIVTQA